ncbi:MAG: monovalent cation:proton antiporter-2 (CPA2) family protein [Sedimenticola sp.]|nr:monovalent cation:proton antiporter-2 (CPA2) family protein [Sedimenticola sp.]
MISVYLADIILLLAAAVVLVPLFQAIGLGAVPGFLVAGVIVGPAGLGLIDNVSEIGHLAEIGVVLLLFVIGIELKPSRLWLMRRLVFGLGTLQVLVTALLIGSAGYLLLDISLRAAVLIGPALALSSTAFVLQLLTEQKLLTSQYGRTSFAILLLQDLAVVPLLALIPLLALPELSLGADIGLALGQSVLILLLVVVVGRYFLHPILYRVALSGNPELFTASAVLIVLASSLATEHAGLSMAMGAFLAGLLISDSLYRHQVMAEIQPFRGLLLGLFFMSMGMSLNLGLLIEKPLSSLLLVSLLIVIKLVVLFPMTALFGLRSRSGLAVSLVLAQGGEFALVLFSLAHQSALLDQGLFQQLLLVVLLSMIVTPMLAQAAQRLVRKQESEPAKTSRGAVADSPVEAPIVLAGFGRVGHRIGDILRLIDKPYVALDCDARVVEAQRARGYPVFFGDVRKPDVLRAAGASNAQTIIVTLNDPHTTENVIASLRQIYPEKKIYARGHSLQECRKLQRLGAAGVVSENMEASMELARMALLQIGMEGKELDRIVNEFRSNYHAQIAAVDGAERE